MIDPLFASVNLNETGIKHMEEVRESFTNLLQELRNVVPTTGREWALVQTKLEEASFYTVKSLKNFSENVEEKN